MPLGRFQVSYGPPGSAVRDRMSNTLYFDIGFDGNPIDWQDLANDLAQIYDDTAYCNGFNIQVRAYDMADAEPRPEKAYSERVASGAPLGGARQVALCLSYYNERNLPRRRGRIYTGPWPASAGLASADQMAQVMSLGQAFTNLGGINVDWQVYSPTEGQARKVTDYWCDNSWDIVRSRKIPATARQEAKTDE